MPSSETSLEGWKPFSGRVFQPKQVVFRNFLRGMETGTSERLPAAKTNFRNFLRGMETAESA